MKIQENNIFFHTIVCGLITHNDNNDTINFLKKLFSTGNNLGIIVFLTSLNVCFLLLLLLILFLS